MGRRRMPPPDATVEVLSDLLRIAQTVAHNDDEPGYARIRAAAEARNLAIAIDKINQRDTTPVRVWGSDRPVAV